MSRIVSFRGLMEPDTQDTIVLHTNTGETGYKIVKFQVIAGAPVGVSSEAVISIWKVSQTTNPASIDFSDQRLLGAAFYENHQNNVAEGQNVIVFDNEIFNQDIFVTCYSSSGAINYYLELEQMDLALDEATVATLKDIRNND